MSKKILFSLLVIGAISQLSAQNLQRIGTGFGLLVTWNVGGIGWDQDEIVELFHLITHRRFHGV